MLLKISLLISYPGCLFKACVLIARPVFLPHFCKPVGPGSFPLRLSSTRVTIPLWAESPGLKPAPNLNWWGSLRFPCTLLPLPPFWPDAVCSCILVYIWACKASETKPVPWPDESSAATSVIVLPNVSCSVLDVSPDAATLACICQDGERCLCGGGV